MTESESSWSTYPKKVF